MDHISSKALIEKLQSTPQGPERQQLKAQLFPLLYGSTKLDISQILGYNPALPKGNTPLAKKEPR